MTSKLKSSIPKLVCGEENGTAFMVSNKIAITATHTIEDHFDKKSQIILSFSGDNGPKEVKAIPKLIEGEKWQNQAIVALELDEEMDGITPLKCSVHHFNAPLACETFGYPKIRSDEGTPSYFTVICDNFFGDYTKSKNDWNLDLRKNDDIHDYEGLSGGPLIFKGFVVGVFINQIKEDGEASRLGATSLYLYKNYFKQLNVDLVVKTIDPSYEEFLKTTEKALRKNLENALPRKISRSNNSYALGLPINIINEKKTGKLDSYIDLLNLDESTVILSEPGGGKTYLLSMLAKDIIENPLIKSDKIPVILKARNWARSYNSLTEGIQKALNYYISIDIKQVENDLRDGKYIILIDGLDEVTDSLDLLIDELFNISKIKDMQLLVTCRNESYHNQLFNFGVYEIEELTDEQIREYVEKELDRSGWHFLNSVEGNLRKLLHNPLFLFMTVIILKNSPDEKLPNNKAELYYNYIKLMNERVLQKGLKKPLKIDAKTKEVILADFAGKTFRQIPGRYHLVDSVSLFLDREKTEIVKKELMETGLVIEENDNLNFFHPSFHEYFFALYMSKKQEKELISFIKEKSNDDSFFEVFIFLAGLLKFDNPQNILLDYLEKNNLYLYRKCLDARFDFGNEIKEKWSENYTIRYFEQVRKSYLQIIDNHFKSIKYCFYPWCKIDTDVRDDYDVQIEGSIDFNTPKINFRFLGIEKTSELPNVIVKKYENDPAIFDKHGNELSTIISMDFNDSWYLNLEYIGLGIDSAREVALHALKKQISSICDEQDLFIIEPPEMLLTQIENTLYKLPKDYGILKEGTEPYMPSKLYKPSLYMHSLDEINNNIFIKKNLMGYAMNNLENYGNLTFIDIFKLFVSIPRLKKLNLDLNDYLLPDKDIEPVHKSEYYYWEVFSDEQLIKRITKFFESYQLSYRYLVENYFPSLKNDLPLYAIGPLKFNIIINFRDDITERIMYHGGSIAVTWEPIEEIKDIKPNVIHDDRIKNDLNSEEYFKKMEKDISHNLSRLGRKRLPFPRTSRSLLVLFINDYNKLRVEVYKQLKEDLSYVLGDLK